MNIDEKTIGTLMILRLSGEFKPCHVHELHQYFQYAVTQDKRIILDLGFSKTPSYCILEPLLKLAGTLAVSKKKLMLAKASGNLRFLLTLLGKQQWFEFHESIHDLVLKESHKQSNSATVPLETEENEGLQPVYFHVPDVSDFFEE